MPLRIDKTTGDAILTKDPETFYNALRNNSKQSVPNLSTPCCGWSSIMTMLYMAEPGQRAWNYRLCSIEIREIQKLVIRNEWLVTGPLQVL